MKKAMLLLLCVVLLMSLYGCDEPTDIDFRPDNSIDPPANIYIGMTREDFLTLYPDKMTNPYGEGVCFDYWGEYAFLEDTEGNPVVVQFKRDNGWYVGSVDAYDKNTISITEETFNQLERGMSVQEIVSLLGCPVPQLPGADVFSYMVGDKSYNLAMSGKTGVLDNNLVFTYLFIGNPDGSFDYPMGTEPWEFVDPE